MTHHGTEIHPGVIDCQTCKFIHVNPLPSEAEVENYYKSEFYEKTKPDYLTRHKQDSIWWELTYRRILRKIRSQHPNGFSLLDYGCGHGMFLDFIARQKCCNYLGGVELSESARKHAQKEHDVFTNYDSLVSWTGKTVWDVINLYQVLEHVRDPRQLLTTLSDHLSKSGMLVITVPNDFNPLQKYSDTAYWISKRDHLNYFNKDSLFDLLESLGLQYFDCMYHFPLELFWLMGDDYRGNDDIGQVCHQKRVKLESTLNPELLENIYNALGSLNIGREITVFAYR